MSTRTLSLGELQLIGIGLAAVALGYVVWRITSAGPAGIVGGALDAADRFAEGLGVPTNDEIRQSIEGTFGTDDSFELSPLQGSAVTNPGTVYVGNPFTAAYRGN